MFGLFKKKEEKIEFTDTDKVLFQPGDKFYYCDHHPWYVVGNVKDGDDVLLVIKSWSKYKKRWCYKAEHIELLAWWVSGRPAGCQQITSKKDKNGYYRVKADKRKV